MGIGWIKRRAGASEKDLRILTTRVGTSLPADYCAFLRVSNGGEPEDNDLAVPEGQQDPGVGINAFLSTAEVASEIETIASHPNRDSFWPTDYIPVAHAEGGNYILLNLETSTVSFWDHELQGTDAIVELAPTFDAFRSRLRPWDPSAAKLKPGQLKHVWVDPELLEELRRES